MPEHRFERECRTPYSEAYLVMEGEAALGRIDLHFAGPVVHGLLVVAERVTQDEVRELIESIDEELVMSADPDCEDVVVQVYQGRELGTYSSQDLEDEEGAEGGGSTWSERAATLPASSPPARPPTIPCGGR